MVFKVDNGVLSTNSHTHHQGGGGFFKTSMFINGRKKSHNLRFSKNNSKIIYFIYSESIWDVFI